GHALWISTFAAAAAQASIDSERFGTQVDALVQRWRIQAAPIRANSAADLLLHVLPSAPAVTASTAATLIGRSPPAVNAAIAHLLEAGVLIQGTVGRRNRVFEAVGLLDALTGFERALASPEGDTRLSPPARRVPRRPAR